MYIDVHTHLNFTDFGDPDGTVERIHAAGVDTFINVGYDLPSSETSRQIAERYPHAFFTAGLQPTELKKCKESDLYRIEELAKHPLCVAVGEIGLDYHYEDTDKPLQHTMFVAQIELANSLGLPVQIHSRDCAEDMLRVLEQNAGKLTHGFMLHCYSHSAEMALRFAELGAYFSFGGTCTFRGSKKVKKSVQALPMERILSETDSPYLTPEPLRGVFPNTPANIPYITRTLAELKGLSVEETARRIRENARRLFHKIRLNG